MGYRMDFSRRTTTEKLECVIIVVSRRKFGAVGWFVFWLNAMLAMLLDIHNRLVKYI